DGPPSEPDPHRSRRRRRGAWTSHASLTQCRRVRKRGEMVVVDDWSLLARVGLGLALAFAVGFEREIRDSPAGARTFALIGVSSAALTAVLYKSSPQGLAGVIIGVGFI